MTRQLFNRDEENLGNRGRMSCLWVCKVHSPLDLDPEGRVGAHRIERDNLKTERTLAEQKRVLASSLALAAMPVGKRLENTGLAK